MNGYIPIKARGRRKQRIAFVDAEPLLYEGLRTILSGENVELVRSLAPGMTKLEQATTLHPDILLMEYHDINEISWILDTLSKDGVERSLLVLRVPQEVVPKLNMVCPRHGLLGRDVSAEKFLTAVRIVANGGSFVDPSISAYAGIGAIQSLENGDAADEGRLEDELSEREKSVLFQIALGHYAKEIAADLNLSIKTVETYKTRATKKLGLSDRVSIVRYAVAKGWFDDLDQQEKTS